MSIHFIQIPKSEDGLKQRKIKQPELEKNIQHGIYLLVVERKCHHSSDKPSKTSNAQIVAQFQ